MNPTASTYTAGMVLHWRPDVNGTGGATTFNVDQLGALPLLLANGLSNPRPGDIVAGQLYNLWYDGTCFRVLTSGSGSGNVTTVFGKPAIPAAQVNADWNASIGAALILNKPTTWGWANLTGVPSTFAPPTPTASTLGGVNSKDCSGTAHVQKVNTDGSITSSADAGGGGTIASTTNLLKGDGNGNAVAATAGTDYMTPSTAVRASQLPSSVSNAGQAWWSRFGVSSPALAFAINGGAVTGRMFFQFVITCPMTFTKAAIDVTTASGTICSTSYACGFVVSTFNAAGSSTVATTSASCGVAPNYCRPIFKCGWDDARRDRKRHDDGRRGQYSDGVEPSYAHGTHRRVQHTAGYRVSEVKR